MPGEPVGKQHSHDRPQHGRERVDRTQSPMELAPILGRKQIRDGDVTAGHDDAPTQALHRTESR